MLITVKDIMGVMESIAPSYLAESWDNVGLQVGDPNWPVRRIWLALDPIPEVIQAAIPQQIDLIITHHPLMLESPKSINLSNPISRIIADAIKNNIAIYASHTNLDKVNEGLNDILARKLNLIDIRPIVPHKKSDKAKLVIFSPKTHEQQILEALFEKNAGIIGNYSKCSFRQEGIGTFQAGELSTPWTGHQGSLEQVDECRIEAIIFRKKASEIIDHVEKNHPYETMAYDIYPLSDLSSSEGLGRTGQLKNPKTLQRLADEIIETFNLSYVRIVGDPDLTINRLAVCSGSGGSLLKNVFSSNVQAYVTGDLKFHDARNIEMHEMGAIDIGHFDSETIYIDELIPKLKNIMENRQWPVKIMHCPVERNPFYLKT